MTDEPTITKRRIEACAMQAQMNAANHGGDAATAAADLMCAFVLISVKSGCPPQKALDAMLKAEREKALREAADRLRDKHYEYMASKGRNPADYASQYSTAATQLRALIEQDASDQAT